MVELSAISPHTIPMSDATSKSGGDGPGLPHGLVLGVTADGVEVVAQLHASKSQSNERSLYRLVLIV